ncbi:VOC family protein [Streptomyces glaucus]|uniref:VOC domain-containing protein n=1 Tax=Streptomyces glaucus TaxID=284029 RepID=A0ABN3J8Q6_9ACTN
MDGKDWRQGTKTTVDGYRIGSVSDLAHPVHPPDTPAHVAYCLAVDGVDRRTETATANGARLVVAPFDAGGQGRTATLIDPAGAAFSLWQPHEFTGWKFPPRLVGAPRHRVVRTCEHQGRPVLAGRARIGAGPWATTPIRRLPHQDLTAIQRMINRALSAARAPVERSVAGLKSRRILRRARCGPNRVTVTAAAALTLERRRRKRSLLEAARRL